MPENSSIARSPLKIVILYSLITVFIIVAGVRYYSKQQSEIRSEIFQDLSTISELKLNQIINWRKERLGDATTIFENKIFVNDIKNWFDNPGNAELKNRLTPLLLSYSTHYHYKSIILLDKELNIKLGVNSNIRFIGDKTKKFIRSVKTDSKLEFSNIYECDICSEVHLDIFVPLKYEKETFGWIILRIEPEDFLFPLIQSWPTKSYSAENLLVSTEDDYIVFLNELRHKKNTSLKLKFKIDSTNIRLPSVIAAMGKEGMFEGIDYRGVPVLSDIKKIPDSPWFLIAKVDIEEIYAPMKESALIISILTGLLLIAVGIGFIWVWTNQKKSLQIQYLEDINREQALIKHFDYVVKHSHDIFILTDRNLKIIVANDTAEKAYGYSKSELIGENIVKLRSYKTSGDLNNHIKELKEKRKLYTKRFTRGKTILNFRSK